MLFRRAFSRQLLLSILWYLFHAAQISATLVNVTIDDSDPLITYGPPSQWSAGETCSFCLARPNASQAFDGTWHDSTFPGGGGEADLRTASLSFTGPAIYVYCILGHVFGDAPDTNTDMTFFIDGVMVGQFVLAPTGATNYDYNVPVYANSSVPPGVHSFTLQNGRVGGAESLALLDYIIYSDGSVPPEEIPPSSSVVTSSDVSSTNVVTSTPIIISSSPSKPPSSSSQLPTPSPSSTTASFSTVTALDPSYSTLQSPTSGPTDSFNHTVSESSPNSSSSHTKTIVIAATISGTVVLLAVVAGLTCFYLRRRRVPHHYDPTPERDITENHMTSGWTGDTWGTEGVETEPEHPSLAPAKHSPAVVRGDPAARERGRARRDGSTKKRARGLTESSTATATGAIRSTPEWSHANRPSTGSTVVDHSAPLPAVELTKIRTHRHPYAARTPEPDIGPPDITDMVIQEESGGADLDGPISFMPVLEDDPIKVGPPQQDSKPEPEPVRSPTLTTASTPVTPTMQNAPVLPFVPPPELPTRRPRPLPTRPILESQAQAAQLRRLNSASVDSTQLHDESPPAYEAASGTHNRV